MPADDPLNDANERHERKLQRTRLITRAQKRIQEITCDYKEQTKYQPTEETGKHEDKNKKRGIQDKIRDYKGGESQQKDK